MIIYTPFDTGSHCKILVPPRLVHFLTGDVDNMGAVRWRHDYGLSVPVALASAGVENSNVV